MITATATGPAPPVTSADRLAALASAPWQPSPSQLPDGIVVSLDEVDDDEPIYEGDDFLEGIAANLAAGEIDIAKRQIRLPSNKVSDAELQVIARYLTDGFYWPVGKARSVLEELGGRAVVINGTVSELNRLKETHVSLLPPSSLPESIVLCDPRTLEGKDVPERRWLVGDWIPATNCTAFYGDGGAGKSLIAQQLQTACATGKPWLGLPTLQCKSIGVYCEDEPDELHRRQSDINAHLGIGWDDIGDMRWQSRVGFDNLLITFDAGGKAELTRLFDDLQTQAKAFGAGLVILDTAADVYGGNENIRPQVRQFIQQCCSRIARAIDGAVLLCAHPSRAGLSSGQGDGGNTAWNNSVRSRLYLARVKADSDGDEAPDNDLRTLTRKKSNYSAAGEFLELRWEHGVFVNTHSTGVMASIEHGVADKAFLAALNQLTALDRDVSISSKSTDFAPRVMKTLSTMKGIKADDLERAMNRLLESRQIRLVDVGMKSRGKKRLERVK